MSEPLVIGLDASTTACKAVVWDRKGTSMAEGRASIPLLMPRPTWHEQPAEAWWSAAVQALREAVGSVDPEHLAALCIAPQRETFVPVDKAGQPLRHAIVWMDERCRDLLPQIDHQYGEDKIHQQTGKPLSGNLSLGKILWLRENEPQVFKRTHKYLDVGAFLAHRLTGHYRTGWGCVDPMGLFDMRHHRWAEDLLSFLGLDVAQMPQAMPPGKVMGEVTREAAETCGLPRGLPVVAGVGDGQAGGMGVKITQPGQAYLNLGTAVISGTHAETYLIDPAFRTMYSALPGAYSLETVLLGGTYTITWFVENWAEDVDNPNKLGISVDNFGSTEDLYDAAIQSVPAGAEGLMLVPYWNSAMNPYWDAAASGIVVGWRGIHRRQHLYRAILEGIGFELRLHIEGVEAALGQTIQRFVAMGGGSRSATWCQIIADITGKSVYRARAPEAAALGAGIQAASGVGLFDDVREAAEAMTHIAPIPFKPDVERHRFYTRLYKDVYRYLFPALQPYVRRLTEETVETQDFSSLPTGTEEFTNNEKME